ncbi:lipoprotein [Spiroplasma culicicola]|uniref:Lipoprotein n=1 Tax=Spiroplasma culicicola AES-1 TaxID=1276246 RepID=W6A6V7_9MOLU|nr:lipoprotein [Spiroplasma culicicola]AHI52863.1 hypothetical protein SCULI_v1c05220 [Spiroplasma culicicola AES-1]
MRKILSFLASFSLVPSTVATTISCEMLTDQEKVMRYISLIEEAETLRMYWLKDYKTILNINWENPSYAEIMEAQNSAELQYFIIANAEWYLNQHLATLIPDYKEYDKKGKISEIYAQDEVWFPPFFNAATGRAALITPLNYKFFSRATRIHLNNQLAKYTP